MTDVEFLNDDEKAMLERAEKATPGPWVNRIWEDAEWNVHSKIAAVCLDDKMPPRGGLPASDQIPNNNFCAHARTDLPVLLRRLSDERKCGFQMSAELEMLREQLQWLPASTPPPFTKRIESDGLSYSDDVLVVTEGHVVQASFNQYDGKEPKWVCDYNGKEISVTKWRPLPTI